VSAAWRDLADQLTTRQIAANRQIYKLERGGDA